MGSEPRRLKAIIKDPQHCKRLAESVQILHERQDFMDLCFVCARGERVFAHKLLICSVSSQMKEMFFENPDSTDLIVIHMPDFEARLLKLMLAFLYEGSLHLFQHDYVELKNLMTLLGVVLKSRSDKTVQPQTDTPQTQPIQTQPAQLVYVQAPGPNNQGQVQYVLASPAMLSQSQVMQVAPTPTSSLPQGQMMQLSTPPASLPQGQMMQVATSTASLPQGQMVQVTTPTASLSQGQIVQANGQMVMQVAQASAPGQMMQMATPTTSLPQGQIMQMATPTTSLPQGQLMQMPPTIMSQASSQMVPQPTQRPQYVMASTASQMTTSRAQAQFTQPQTTSQRTIARSRSNNQLAPPSRTNPINSVRTRRMMRAPVPMGQNRSITATRTQRTRHSAQ